MADAFVYLAASACLAAVVILWFTIVYRVLAQKREDVFRAREQMHMHWDGYSRVRNGTSERTARRMVEISNMIYEQVMKSYNDTLKKPVCHLPGLVLGFRAVEERKPLE